MRKLERIDRFNFYGWGSIRKDEEGKWCRYEEANSKYLALLTELGERCEELTRQRNVWKNRAMTFKDIGTNPSGDGGSI